jgi:ribosomal subunit interface protein
MKTQLQVTYRNMSPSAALEAEIREKAEKLERFWDQTISCRVVLEAENHRHRHGNLYRVNLEIKVPDKEIIAGRASDLHQAHDDVYVAIRDAFDSARRQLEDYNKRRQQL